MQQFFFITIIKFEGYKLNVKVGDIAERDIRATKEVEDKYETDRLKREAANSVGQNIEYPFGTDEYEGSYICFF